MDETLIEIALDRFSPMRKGNAPTKIEDLARKYDRDPAVIVKAISAAFTKGLVNVERIKYPTPIRNSRDEELLLQKFPNLHVAIVVETSDRLKDSANDRALLGDKVHAELGNAVAKFVSKGSVVRDGDKIALGSGRGVFSFLRALTFFEKLRAQNVTAISLTGDVYARSHSWWKDNVTSIGLPGLNCQLDADDHLSLLGLSFLWPLQVIPISRSIAWDPQELKRIGEQTVLDRVRWKNCVPDLGIVGVGVFSDGHRFYQEVEAEPERQEEKLAPIIKDLTRLNDQIKESKLPYVPVGDICNRLFYVRPPDGVRVSASQEKDFADRIHDINEKLLTATDAQLGEIRSLILVAGTRKKAPAIKQLLEGDNYNIRTLCIDQDAANEILGRRPTP